MKTGDRLGIYEVVEPLGKGGMGEVYLAHDTRLDRRVALKLLPDELAEDPERLARLEREARVLAQLEHPNVAAVYGLEREGETLFVAMQYAEGESLAESLSTGPLPVGIGLEIALRIAEALEAAHERGIVHRDLKPANVHAVVEGNEVSEVKVLDFGLAKLYEPGGIGGSASTEISGSPTVMATSAGVILGTAAYMSPEQARGGSVDRRADIWAFGCVLYEMLTGRRAFEGDTVTDVFAAIVKEEPDLTALPAATPAPVRGLLDRCFEKSSRQRLRDIGEARVVLESLGGEREGTVLRATHGIGGGPETGRTRRRETILAWSVAVLASLVAAAAIWSATGAGPRDAAVQRFSINVPSETGLAMTPLATDVQIDPTGRRIVFVGTPEPISEIESATTMSQIWLRPLDSLEAGPLPGTQGGVAPFFSPDGERVGFFADDRLQTLEIGATAARTVTGLGGAQPRGAAWGPDGTIVYSLWPGTSGLLRVPETGGEPEELTVLDADAGEISHRHPAFLPGGRVVYTVLKGDVSTPAEILLGTVDPETGEQQLLPAEGALHARWADSGHLVYAELPTSAQGGLISQIGLVATGARLMAMPFDPRLGEPLGEPVPVLDGFNVVPLFGTADFSVSRSGTLVYLPLVSGPPGPDLVPLVWVTPAGSTEPALAGRYLEAVLSPDGERLALMSIGRDGPDLWVHELASGRLYQLTFEINVGLLAWRPDGRTLTFGGQSRQGGADGIFEVAADASGSPRLLLGADELSGLEVSQYFANPLCWDGAGRRLLVQAKPPETSFDLSIVSFAEDGSVGVVPVATTAAEETEACFSPDDRWISYVSDASGEPQVYLIENSPEGARRQVSREGGVSPRWSPDGSRLYYRDLGERLMVLEIPASGPPRGTPEPLWQAGPDGPVLPGFILQDIDEAGRALVVDLGAAPRAREILVVTDWFAELERLAPSGR